MIKMNKSVKSSLARLRNASEQEKEKYGTRRQSTEKTHSISSENESDLTKNFIPRKHCQFSYGRSSDL
jgi:hypothetical protein